MEVARASNHQRVSTESRAMTREDFLRAISDAKIRSNAFNLNSDGDECYVLAYKGGSWSVYYSERGLETEKRHFSSEGAALGYLLGTLKNDPSTRIERLKDK
jgi:hypothetical protein